MRRNNFAEMSLEEQLVVIREEICDNLCRFREKCERCEMTNDDFKKMCDTCIVNRL